MTTEAVIGGLVSALAPWLLEKLSIYIVEEFHNNRDAAENFIMLEITLLEAQNLLARLSLFQFQHQQRKLQRDVEIFTNLCYDAEDFVNKVRECKNCKSWQSWANFLQRVPSHTKKLLEKIRDQLYELENLKEVEDNLNLEKPQNNNDNPRLTGRENEVRKIRQDLISQPEKNGVSILGRRGLGKTALARVILQDTQISDKFTHRVWIEANMDGNFNLETAKKKLANVDSKKHLLIILDNLLSIGQHFWIDFWDFIKSKMSEANINNVKLLVTALNPIVSELTNTKPCYLNPLPDPVCEKLIIENAMSHGQSSQNRVKTQLSDELVTKCEGLPLLAKIVGHKLETPQHAEGLNLSEVWEWVDFKTEIFPLLKRSYKHMSPGLIKGFAYFSLFPHNHEFRIIVPPERENHNNIDDLFQLWESEGFVTPRENSSTFENIRKEHLNGLLERSLLQCDESGTVYKLQRLNLKIAEVASSKTCLRVDDEVPPSLPKNTRHLSLLRENFEFLEASEKGDLKRLRTILSLIDRGRTGVESKIPISIFQKGSSLRVLSLNGFNIQYLPSSIKSLIHLRHLDVSRTPIRSLPNELANLFNLHTLKLTETPQLLTLPDNFHKLTNLQFLRWDICLIQSLFPSHVGNLSKLRELPLFCVGIEDGFFIKELQNMDQLRSSICIKNLENVQRRADAEQAMLCKKNLLTTIELEWLNETQDSSVAAEVLEGLKPHVGLSKLKITGYSGYNFPAWISNSTLKLRELHLYKCDCSSLPALGQLKDLKRLVVEDLSNLIQVDNQLCGHGQDADPDGSFLSLEFLEINDMAELKGWTWKGNMPKLHDLRFINCPKMNVFSSLENLGSLEKLEISGCEELETLPKLPQSLKSLVIQTSNKLKRNCEVRWEKITGISVVIDNQVINSTPRDQHHQNDQAATALLSTSDMNCNEISDGFESNNNDGGCGQFKRKGLRNHSSTSTSKVAKNDNNQGEDAIVINYNKFSFEVLESNNDDDGRRQLKRKEPMDDSSPCTSMVEKNESDQVFLEVRGIVTRY